MRITDTHVYFWGGEFSNFYPCEFHGDLKKKGPKFHCSEQAFMWTKAEMYQDHYISEKILACKTPQEAKALGRQVRDFHSKTWDCVKVGIMTFLNYLKYTQNPDLEELLFSTGEKTLVEASPVDLIWGVGLKEDDDLILDEKNWRGQNLLGKCLMDVRRIIRS